MENTDHLVLAHYVKDFMKRVGLVLGKECATWSPASMWSSKSVSCEEYLTSHPVSAKHPNKMDDLVRLYHSQKQQNELQKHQNKMDDFNAMDDFISQHPSHHAQHQSSHAQLTGTFIFKRDRQGNIIHDTFEVEVPSGLSKQKNRRESYKYTNENKIIYIKGKDGKIYICFDPKKDTREIKLKLLGKYKVSFIDELEGKEVQFVPTGKNIEMANREIYPLVEILF